MLNKTIKCKIHSLTGNKENILSSEFREFQQICREVKQAVDWNILPDKPFNWFKTNKRYGGTVWGAIRSVSKFKQFSNLHTQPLYLRNDCFKIEERDTKISKHWLRLPTKQKFGGVWLPLIVPDKYQHLLDNKICDSKITRDRKGNWFAHISIKKDVDGIPVPSNSNVLAVDLGERYIATSVSVTPDLSVQKVRFYGKNVRGIRRHYAWLRKRLGNKKLLSMIKKIGSTEKRKVNDCLHKISRQIVDEAKERKAVIVLGDLKGIRKRSGGKGKRFSRIVNTMPFNKLSQMISYKAAWDGVPVVTQSEAYTSVTCHSCGSRGSRKTQANFNCNSCGLTNFNADANGSINLARGFLATCGESGLTDLAHNFGGSP